MKKKENKADEILDLLNLIKEGLDLIDDIEEIMEEFRSSASQDVMTLVALMLKRFLNKNNKSDKTLDKKFKKNIHNKLNESFTNQQLEDILKIVQLPTTLNKEQSKKLQEFNIKVKQIGILEVFKIIDNIEFKQEKRIEQFLNNIISRSLGINIPDKLVPQTILKTEKLISKTVGNSRMLERSA